MDLQTRLIQYQSPNQALRQTAQQLLIEQLTDAVTAIQENVGAPEGELLEQLNRVVAAIQQNADAPDARLALAKLTKTVIEKLDEYGGGAPVGPVGP